MSDTEEGIKYKDISISACVSSQESPATPLILRIAEHSYRTGTNPVKDEAPGDPGFKASVVASSVGRCFNFRTSRTEGSMQNRQGWGSIRCMQNAMPLIPFWESRSKETLISL